MRQNALIKAIWDSQKIPTIFKFAIIQEYSFLDFIQTYFDPNENGFHESK
jgi:hypothetical protein